MSKKKGDSELSLPKEVLDKAVEHIMRNGLNGVEETVRNGLAGALGIEQFNAFGLPGFPGAGGEQISNVNTSYKNLRWYLVSNFRQLLSQLYIEIGLISTIVDVPVDDALRGGIDIKSQQLDEDQIAELQVSLDRDDDLTKAGQAAKWNRLFGGAGIIILSDQDPETPFNLAAIDKNSDLDFRPADMWELFQDAQNIDDFDRFLQEHNSEFYNYYGEKVHASRVMRLKGLTAPSFIRARLRGWGFSVVEQLIRSINQYLKATDLSFEVLDEFKLDVYKIKNLVNTLLAPNGQQKIQQRVQLANYQKNYQNAIVMDSEDDFDHKQLSFTGLAEAMDGIRMQVAADMRMPRSKLFGEAGGGLSSGSNEGDLEVYNSMVESQVRNKIKYDLLRICEIKCQKLFGFVPDDLTISFKPLRVLSAVDEENVKTQKFTRILQARQAGEITTFEFRESCNKGNLFDVTLDSSGDQLNPEDPEVKELVDEGSAAGKEDMADEASAEDSKKEKSKKDKVKNEALLLMPAPFNRMERVQRTFKNSAEYDKAAYEADGGDEWIASGRKAFFENPGNVDEQLWAKAKEASAASFGKVKWQFVTWWYKKQGGKFK